MTLAVAVWIGLLPAVAAAQTCPDGAVPAIEVTERIDGIDIVTNRSVDDLGELWRADGQPTPLPQGGLHFLGLYAADHGAQTQLGFRTLTDPGGRVCLSITDVTVRLTLQDRRIYVGRELTRGSCVHRVVLDHERRHAAVSEATIADAAAALRSDLPDALGDLATTRMVDQDDLQAAVDRLTEAIGGFATASLSAAMDRARARHALIDDPSQLRAEQAQCGDDFTEILSRIR